MTVSADELSATNLASAEILLLSLSQAIRWGRDAASAITPSDSGLRSTEAR